LLVSERVHRSIGHVVDRLGAERAVLGAAARFCVDDGAEMNFTPDEMLFNAVCSDKEVEKVRPRER